MILSILMLFLLPVSRGKVYVTPNIAYLSSSLSLEQIFVGVEQANKTIETFENVFKNSTATFEEAKKLLQTIIKSGKYELENAVDIYRRLEILPNRRMRRDLSNPLYAVGDLADWAFGLVSHSEFKDFKDNVQGKVNYLESEHEEVHAAIIANAKAINESVTTLKKFESFLNLLIKTNDDLMRSERFILKIIRLKFELDTCLESLFNLAMIISEVLDRSDQGFASRFLFSSEYLKKTLLVLNDRHPSMSPLYGSNRPSKYFQLPLAISSFNKTHFHSIIKIPLIDSDSTFEDEEMNYHNGFVILSNFEYKVHLTFPQYEDCVANNKNTETVCFNRPCLVKTGQGEDFICFMINQTNFLISRSDFTIQTLCSDQVSRIVKVPQTNQFSHISVPEHCQVNSKYFIIKSISTFPIFNSDITNVNKIYKIEQDNIIVGKETEDHKKINIKVETKEILNHINQTRNAFKAANQDLQIPSHFEPLAITGTTVGSLSIIFLLVLAFIICRHV